MRVSYNWLQEYVDCELPPAELADLLTMAGLEVEGIEEVGSALKGVVVARSPPLRPIPRLIDSPFVASWWARKRIPSFAVPTT